MNNTTRILITGAAGQLGENLVDFLSADKRYQVVATDLRPTNYQTAIANEALNVLDFDQMEKLVKEHDIDEIYHLAALLSATGEKNPLMAWEINMKGLLNVLECAKTHQVKVFWPSSIAVFGETTPKHMTPQRTIAEPSTAYGISKVAGELWCEYYYNNFGVDVRSVRFPGLISWKGKPGGGTTDYAVDIYHKALEEGKYTCFLNENTYLPMLYIDDAIAGVVQLMSAPVEQIKHRDSYNISGMSFSPREIFAEIQKHLPDFTMDYAVDFRQQIADSWPASIEDVEARNDWGWNPQFDLQKMTEEILTQLSNQMENKG